MRRSSSGISPVVATVILVAIAIVIAIAVAFWASGLVGIFTRFEKLEVTAAYATTSSQVTLVVRNTGSAPATIDDIYVNGQPSSTAGVDITCTPISVNQTMTPGASTTCTLSGTFTSGVTYEFAVHTASGKTYPTAVLIP